MSNGRPPKLGQRVPELREEDGRDGHPWPHPGDEIDARAEGEAVADGELHLELLADKQRVGDLFRRLLADCLPSRKTYGGGRRVEAGYRRMVATVYEVAPELFDGLTPREVAASLGITWWAFRKQRRAVRDMLAARAAAQAARRPRRGTS